VLHFVDNSPAVDYIGFVEVTPDDNQKQSGFPMKSMYERAALDEVVRRIDSLNPGVYKHLDHHLRQFGV
jgi:hypothetical protein